ncbi:MAG TPA: dihydrofolate reductase family protein [Kribbella sp.]
MGKTVLFMSMSLDGFISGPGDDHANPLGIGGERLHDWFTTPGPARDEMLAEYQATGAVLTGRRTYDLADGWGGDHHGVPIVVVTHAAPQKVPKGPSPIVFVTDGVEVGVAAAKLAAKDKDRDILVHGAELARELLRLGHLDELQIHLVPVLLREGRKLFEHIDAEHIELAIIRVLPADDVTHLRYRVVW